MNSSLILASLVLKIFWLRNTIYFVINPIIYTQINTLTFLCLIKMHSGQRKPLQPPQDVQLHHFSSELNSGKLVQND